MEILAWVEGSTAAEALRASGTLYMLVNAAHILGIGLIVGAILPLDMLLLGVVRGVPIAVVGPFLSRAAAAGVALAVVTGPLLWSVRAREYLENPAFVYKLALIAMALLNVAAQHAGRGWGAAIRGEAVPLHSRVLAAASALLWLAALLAGRWIAFA